MANPTRPATSQIISSVWGQAVADTVVRRYPNAATRDADLAGHSSADLLGQVVMLTDTGSLLQYVGPILGWRPPWNTAWGMPIAPVANNADLNVAPLTTYMEIVACPFVAGRRYQAVAEVCYVSNSAGYCYLIVDGAASIHRTEIRTVANGECMKTFSYNYSAATTRTANVTLQGNTINFQGTKGMGRLGITDVGPGANPTALVLNDAGELTVDPELLTPEYAELWTPPDLGPEPPEVDGD